MAENSPEPKMLLADRGYDVHHIGKEMEKSDILKEILMRKPCTIRVGIDHTLYWSRNTGERSFNTQKNGRRVTARYDKAAESIQQFTYLSQSAYGSAICQKISS